MKRRRLIKLAAFTLGGLAMPLPWLSSLRADTLFSDLFGDVALAARLGRSVAAEDPDAGARGRTLVADLAAHAAADRGERLRTRIEDDFRSLDVVVADGWVMARAEADLCAAVHLDRSRT